MELKSESVDFDGVQFTTQSFAAMQGLQLMGRLAATIGPALAVLASAQDYTLEQMAPVLAKSLQGLKEDEVGELALAILKSTSATLDTPQGRRRIEINNTERFNQVFTGRLKIMFQVLAHALKVNYGDFGLGGDETNEAPDQAADSEAK